MAPARTSRAVAFAPVRLETDRYDKLALIPHPLISRLH